jgi:ribosome maturation protein SDO1
MEFQHFAHSIARIKKAGKEFIIIIDDAEAALSLKEKLKKGAKADIETLQKICPTNFVFLDEKKGLKPSQQELQSAFGTTDFFKIAEEIIRDGEIVLPLQIRRKLIEEKTKQIINFIARNAIDPRTKALHPVERIEAAFKQAGIKVDEFKSVDEQIKPILNQLSRVLPLKIENRKIEVTIPAAFTGKAFSLLARFDKQKEEWKDDGSLVAVVVLPSALQPEFFEKLNKATQGTATTRDLGEA